MVFLSVTRGRVVTSNRYYVCCTTYMHDLPKVFLALLETEDRERVAAWSSLEALLILWLRSINSGFKMKMHHQHSGRLGVERTLSRESVNSLLSGRALSKHPHSPFVL